MQVTEFSNAIIDFPDGKSRLASFAGGVLSIAGLGHTEALMVIKLIEHAARGRVTKPAAKQVDLVDRLGDSLGDSTPMRPESVSISVQPESELDVSGAMTGRADGGKPNAPAVPASSPDPDPDPVVIKPEIKPETEPETKPEPEPKAKKPEKAEKPEPRGAAPKRRRGRPPGSKNKPKPEPEPDVEEEDSEDEAETEQTEQTEQTGARPGMDPAKVEWPEKSQEAPAAKPEKPQGGKPQVSVTDPPAAVVSAAKNFKSIIGALGDAGLKDEPIIFLSPETISLVNEQSLEHGPIEPGQLLNSNGYRWILAHREAIECGAPGISPLRLIAGKRSMADLIAQLVRMIAFAY